MVGHVLVAARAKRDPILQQRPHLTVAPRHNVRRLQVIANILFEERSVASLTGPIEIRTHRL